MKLSKKKHQSSEGPISPPGDKSVQDSEQLQLNTTKAENTEECQLWAQSLSLKTISKPLAPVKTQQLHKSTEISWSTLPTANTKLKTINWCTPPVDKREMHTTLTNDEESPTIHTNHLKVPPPPPFF